MTQLWSREDRKRLERDGVFNITGGSASDNVQLVLYKILKFGRVELTSTHLNN